MALKCYTPAPWTYDSFKLALLAGSTPLQRMNNSPYNHFMQRRNITHRFSNSVLFRRQSWWRSVGFQKHVTVLYTINGLLMRGQKAAPAYLHSHHESVINRPR